MYIYTYIHIIYIYIYIILHNVYIYIYICIYLVVFLHGWDYHPTGLENAQALVDELQEVFQAPETATSNPQDHHHHLPLDSAGAGRP